MTWSTEAHGSDWVHRQTLHFLRDEFLQVAHSPVLPELNKRYLIEAIQSDFLQVSAVIITFDCVELELKSVGKVKKIRKNRISAVARHCRQLAIILKNGDYFFRKARKNAMKSYKIFDVAIKK